MWSLELLDLSEINKPVYAQQFKLLTLKEIVFLLQRKIPMISVNNFPINKVDGKNAD